LNYKQIAKDIIKYKQMKK